MSEPASSGDCHRWAEAQQAGSPPRRFARFLGNCASMYGWSNPTRSATSGSAKLPFLQIHNLLIGSGYRSDASSCSAPMPASSSASNLSTGCARARATFMQFRRELGAGLDSHFRQLWLKRAKALGVAGDFGHYSYNVEAARQGKTALPSRLRGSADRLPDGVAYAYHFDAALLRRMLRDYAQI